jgi:hypothetical protein
MSASWRTQNTPLGSDTFGAYTDCTSPGGEALPYLHAGTPLFTTARGQRRNASLFETSNAV